jgi:hypothetical protein
MLTWLCRHRRTAALAAAISLLAPSAYALFDPTGALRLAVLIRIAAIAAQIHSTAGAIATATRAIQERQEAMFPAEALATIGSVFQDVRSVADELAALREGWTLTDQADLWRSALVEDADFEREEWEALWGRASGPGRDLHDLAGWSSNRRYRSAASVFAVHDQWQAAAGDLASKARAGGEGEASALRSLRLTAVGTALSLQQAAAANKLAAEQLDALQSDLDDERHREILARSLGNALLRPFERRASANLGLTLDVEGRP